MPGPGRFLGMTNVSMWTIHKLTIVTGTSYYMFSKLHPTSNDPILHIPVHKKIGSYFVINQQINSAGTHHRTFDLEVNDLYDYDDEMRH